MSQYLASVKAECIRLRVEERMVAGEIALRTGVNKWTIKSWLRDYPFTPKERAELSRQNSALGRRVQGPGDWTAAELGRLRQTFLVLSDDDLLAEFPGRTIGALRLRAYKLGLKRIAEPSGKLHPLIRRLRDTRLRMKIPQNALAKRAGLDRSRLSKWENGQANPDWMLLETWANALGFDFVLRDKIEGLPRLAPPTRDQLMARKAA